MAKKIDFSRYSTEDLDNAYLLNSGDPEFTEAVGQEIDRRTLAKIAARKKKIQ